MILAIPLLCNFIPPSLKYYLLTVSQPTEACTGLQRVGNIDTNYNLPISLVLSVKHDVFPGPIITICL